VRCVPYHAGLDAATRQRNQASFLAEEVEVVVATVAFGMGIDRPDVRFVVHAAMPKGVEQFAQETGRSGRDGLPAECVLLYSGADFHGWRSLQERSTADALAQGLSIDPLEAERARERLSEMYGFATSAVCRHKFLVEHFGEPWSERASCGACDVCLGELSAIGDPVRVAQMILSCIVRCEQRYGATHVADVLRGAETAGIRSAGHARLSTFGLMREHSAREIRHWIEQLIGLDHVRVAPGRYPTLSLSSSGVEVMKAQRPVTLYESPRPPKSRKAARALAGDLVYDASLFERLRALRRKLAHERGVPPYVIFGDRTLQELAAARPNSLEELRGIRGIGEVKLRELGPTFLAEIQGHPRA
jgi:ATP-dependent DNA helicase RecQ